MKDNEYHRQYNIERYYKLRKERIEALGGKCSQCGSNSNLELDHVDYSSKVFDICKKWSNSLESLDSELLKCQVLCHDCHQIKSVIERGKVPAKNTHGTLSSYRYCKCELCKKANTDWQREYRKTRRCS